MREEMVKAVNDGDEEAVARLLSKEPALAGQCDEDGVSFIFLALYHRHENIAMKMADLVPGLSLHEAAALGKHERLAFLLELEPNLIDTPSGDGFLALHLAAFFARVETVAFLIKKGAKPDAVTPNPMGLRPLNSAVAGGCLACVRLILEAGANPEGTQAGGITALMGAAGAGNTEIVELLLDYDVNVGKRCDNGLNAADYARLRGHKKLADSLDILSS